MIDLTKEEKIVVYLAMKHFMNFRDNAATTLTLAKEVCKSTGLIDELEKIEMATDALSTIDDEQAEQLNDLTSSIMSKLEVEALLKEIGDPVDDEIDTL